MSEYKTIFELNKGNLDIDYELMVFSDEDEIEIDVEYDDGSWAGANTNIKMNRIQALDFANAIIEAIE